MPNTVALDLGSYTLKAVMGHGGRQPQITKTAEAFNPLGYVIGSDENTIQNLSLLIENFLHDHNLARNDIRLALPETLVSTKVISIPSLSDSELASAISWQAEQHIPIPLEELALEYQVLSRPKNQDKQAQMKVLLIGTRKSVVDRYLEAFYRLGIEPTLLETQTVSIYRSMEFTSADPTTLVAHIGAATTDLAIVEEGELAFIYSNPNGGQVLSRSIEQSLQLDAKQAEQYKRTYGLMADQLQGKLREVLLPSVRALMNEMQKAIQFYLTQNPAGGVKRILLSGGTAQLPGLVEVLAEQLGAEVLIASPFAQAKGQLPEFNHPAFSVCMGLLNREI
jgi:type IV pilus assembly protein PilM